MVESILHPQRTAVREGRECGLHLTTGILIYLPASREPSRWDEAERVAAMAEGLGYVMQRSRPYLLACREGPAIEGNRRDQSAGFMLLDLYPGTAASGRRFAPSETLNWADCHAAAEREAQFYNLFEATPDSLRIESDPIGMKPFYLADLGQGTLIASRIVDMLRIFPELTQPADLAGLYQLMTFRAPMADRTLHRRIRRSVSGGCYSWDPARGLRVSRARRLQAPPVDGVMLVDDALPRLKQLLLRSLREKTAGLHGPIAISLSGGFDSRLLAALAVEAGLPVQAFSFGRRYHPEIQSAKAAARALDIPLRILPYPTDGPIQRLPFHLETVEGTADLATSLIANLFSIARPAGTPILHGFAGDPLAGNHLRHLTAGEYRTVDTVADGAMRFNSVGSSVDFEGLLHVAAPRGAVRDEIRSNLLEGCAPHQAYCLWDFEHKQRRYVGAHFPMIGSRFDTVAPYYDRDLFAFWLSVPPVGLDGRSLFRTFLAKFYPALARIPHSEEPAPITPNLHYQLARFLRQAPYLAADRVMGPGWAARVARSFSMDRYIWSLANLAGKRQRAHMLTRIGALRPELQQVLGLDVDADFVERLTGDLQATRGLFLVAEYAAWLQHRLQATD